MDGELPSPILPGTRESLTIPPRQGTIPEPVNMISCCQVRRRSAVIAPLEKTSPLPLYFQLQERLRAAIEAGEIEPGAQIPSEGELCRRYDVSHATVKQALGNLVNQQLLYRVRGKGTFVAEPRVQKGPRKLQSFTEEMHALGYLVSSRVLEASVVPANTVIAGKLRMNEGESATLVRRLRLASDRPIALQSAYLPAARCPGLIHEDLSGSLYERLRRYGLRPALAHETYTAVVLGQDEAELLDMVPGSPALRCERVSRSTDGQPIEYVQSVMRGDLYEVNVELMLT